MRGVHNTAAELQKFHISLCTDQHLSPPPRRAAYCIVSVQSSVANLLLFALLLGDSGGSRQEAAQAVSNREGEVSAEWGLVWTSAFRQAHKLGSFASHG